MTNLVLVTGACGRIGRCVAPGLASLGLPVRATDIVDGPDADAPFAFHRVDLNDASSVRELCEGVEAVVHLAGHPNSSDWEVLERSNINPTRILLEAAIATGVRRFVYASSIHVAGFAPADARMAPDLAYRPDGPYGLSKALGELMLRQSCDRDGMIGVAMRICSFRDRPGCARELRTWISPDDMVRLAHACVTARVGGFHAVWGLSRNRRAEVDAEHWRAIGYEPQDDAEVHVGALLAAGVDTAVVSEWPYLGGAMAGPRGAGTPPVNHG